MPVTSGEFFRRLEASRLLAAEEIAELRRDSEMANLDGQAVAVRLVQRNKLTPYQAKQLLAGRTRGFLLGNYRILEALGKGGMGMVFKGEHQVLRRLAAIKVLPPKAAAQPEAVARFHREARATAQLEHENIVRAYTVDEEGEAHFIALEFLPGRSLKKEIEARGRLPVGEAASVIHQVALGLEHALERGVIHRDIKPSNIMVLAQGKAKILDMGLARFFHDSADETLHQLTMAEPGAMVGTVDYVAPEQAEDSNRADTRSDIYSLGCTLYHCVAGRVPFPEGTAVQKLLKHRDTEPVPLEQIVPEIPPAVAAIVRRMMAKRPADRYQRPSEVAQALAPYISAGIIAPRAGSGVRRAASAKPPMPPPERRPDQPRETPAQPHEPAPVAQDRTQAPAVPGPATPAAAKPSAHRELESNEVLAAIAAASIEAPPSQTLPVFKPQRLSSHWHYTIAAGVAATLLVAGAAGLWRATNRGTLIIARPAAELIDAANTRANAASPQGSVDGHPLPLPLHASDRCEIRLSAGAHTLKLEWPGFERLDQELQIARGQIVTVMPKPLEATRRAADWSKIQKRVPEGTAFGSRSQDIAELRREIVEFRGRYPSKPEARRAIALMARLLWPVDSLRLEQVNPRELQVASLKYSPRIRETLVGVLGDTRGKAWGGIHAITYSPGGKSIACAGEDGTLTIWDAATGELRSSLQAQGLAVTAVAATSEPSPRLVSGAADGQIWFWNLETGGHEAAEVGHSVAIRLLCASPDGRWLASGGADGEVRIWEIPMAALRHKIAAHAGEITSLSFAPDGQTLATADLKGVTLWDVPTGQKRTQVQNAIGPAAFSRDGSILAAAGQGARITLWDAQSLGEKGSLQARAGRVKSLVFSPDGRWLAGGSDRSTVVLWELAGRQVKQILDPRGAGSTSVAFSPDSQALASGGSDGAVRIWSIHGEPVFKPAGHTLYVSCLDFSPDGRALATGSYDKTAIVWDLVRGAEKLTLRGHIELINAVTFSWDGKWLATASDDRTAKLWDATSGREKRTLRGHTGAVRAVLFGSETPGVITGSSDGSIRIWDIEHEGAPRSFQKAAKAVTALVLSPDGKMLASGEAEGGVRLWDLAAGRETAELQTQGPEVSSLRFLYDGTVLAWTSAGSIKLRHVSAMRERVLNGSGARLLSLALSSDGKTLAASAQDGTVQLWGLPPDAARLFDQQPIEPQTLLKMERSRGAIRQVAFSPEGRHLATANGNASVYILRLEAYPRAP